jgi:hypothetical protein
MKVNASIHAGRGVALLATAALVAALSTGCGSSNSSYGGGGSQSAADFIRQVTTQFSRAQFGPLWDTLHPADQAIVSRARYMACQGSGFDLTKFKVLQTYADTVYVAGRSTPSTAVSVQVTSDDGLTTATMHAVTINGKWRWILSPSQYSTYKQGKCPASA